MVPADTPNTTPALFTEAIPGAGVPHVPPVADDTKVVVLPVHTLCEPDMVPDTAAAFTVTLAVATAKPHVEDTK